MVSAVNRMLARVLWPFLVWMAAGWALFPFGIKRLKTPFQGQVWLIPDNHGRHLVAVAIDKRLNIIAKIINTFRRQKRRGRVGGASPFRHETQPSNNSNILSRRVVNHQIAV